MRIPGFGRSRRTEGTEKTPLISKAKDEVFEPPTRSQLPKRLIKATKERVADAVKFLRGKGKRPKDLKAAQIISDLPENTQRKIEKALEKHPLLGYLSEEVSDEREL